VSPLLPIDRCLVLACRATGCLALAATALPAAAQGSAAAQPLWEIGVFATGLSQQAYPGAAQNVKRALVLPYGIYRGRVLRVDRGTAGLRALKTPTYELDIGFSGSLGSSSSDVEARRGMPDLGTLVEFGPRLKWNLADTTGSGGGRWRAELPLRGVFDLSDGFAHRGLAFEPELVYERRTRSGIAYSTSIGAVWGDRRLADTLYGVAPVYATATRAAYRAEAGLISTRVSLSVSRSLSPDWRVFAFGRYDAVSGAANESSPLVRRRDGASVGLAFSYTWLRSERRAED
jgi:outer membrane scaffolding protein for murein synthesis (MipA/OmpV family)